LVAPERLGKLPRLGPTTHTEVIPHSVWGDFVLYGKALDAIEHPADSKYAWPKHAPWWGSSSLSPSLSSVMHHGQGMALLSAGYNVFVPGLGNEVAYEHESISLVLIWGEEFTMGGLKQPDSEEVRFNVVPQKTYILLFYCSIRSRSACFSLLNYSGEDSVPSSRCKRLWSTPVMGDGKDNSATMNSIVLLPDSLMSESCDTFDQTSTTAWSTALVAQQKAAWSWTRQHRHRHPSRNGPNCILFLANRLDLCGHGGTSQ
jgi:hypothetical protein